MEPTPTIVLTFNNPEYLSRCLDSIEAQSVPLRPIVWDNGNGADAFSSRAEVIGTHDNIPYAKAHNRAVATLGDWERVLFVNDDAILHDGCVEAMLDHPESSIVGTLNLHSEDYTTPVGVKMGGTVNHAGVQVRPQPFHLGRFNSREMWEGKCAEVDAVTFAVVMLTRGVWEDVGGLDERYEWSFEDTDFCVAAKRKGHRITCCRKAIVTHDELGTRTSANDARNYEQYRWKWYT